MLGNIAFGIIMFGKSLWRLWKFVSDKFFFWSVYYLVKSPRIISTTLLFLCNFMNDSNKLER